MTADRAPDLLLHPVRLRIVQALVRRSLTPGELKDVLGDVAQATLYRHIRALEAGGLLEVTDKRQVRGAVERTYRVVEEEVSLSAGEVADAEPADHFRFFATFVGTLLTDFAAYLNNDPLDIEEDRIGYRQVPLWLSGEELDELTSDLRAVLERRLDNSPAPGRRRRLLSTVVMPDDRGRPAPQSTGAARAP